MLKKLKFPEKSQILMKAFIFMMSTAAILLSVNGNAQPEVWDVNDVSVLLPLPTDLTSDAILKTTSEGERGALLPGKYLNLLPPLAGSDHPEFVKSQLAVVGIRIDPCFPGIDPSGAPCRVQIRMVWQPLTSVNGKQVSTLDAAVHTFYDLSQTEFSEFSQKLFTLNKDSKVNTQGLPLQIHPALASKGYASPYWPKLKTLVLAYAGEFRLSRITFMTLEVPGQMWDFGGFDIDQKRAVHMVIPRIGTRQQSLVNRSQVEFEFLGGEKPEPPLSTPDILNPVVTNSARLLAKDEDLLRSSVEATYRIENPKFHSPATVECVSCHISQSVRGWAIKKFPEFNFDQSIFKFTSPLNLENQTGDYRAPKILRAFGYQGSEPSVNQRTINESANVAEEMTLKVIP
jgi:hypothetical protein